MPYYAKLMNRSITIAVLAGALFGAAISYNFKSWIVRDGGQVFVTANGAAVWLYQDSHNEHHTLPVEKFGTPSSPKGLDIVPLTNRAFEDESSHYTGLHDGQVFSLDRTMVSGSITIQARDVTPLDTVTSLDTARVYASFSGPNNEHFEVRLVRLAPGTLQTQTFGGVAFNHFIHEGTGLGTDKLFTEFAYVWIHGFGDVYRNGVQISEDNYIYIGVSQRAHALSKDKVEGRYNYENPLGKLLVHFVVLPYSEKYGYNPIPTGVFGPRTRS